MDQLKQLRTKIKEWLTRKEENADLIKANNCLLQKGVELQVQVHEMHERICHLEDRIFKYTEIHNALHSADIKINEVHLEIITPELSHIYYPEGLF